MEKNSEYYWRRAELFTVLAILSAVATLCFTIIARVMGW